MFSIAAINDTDSREQWEPLAPTKEAQEFHVTQMYHEGLVKLQSKEYEKAWELLESVLKDPLISNAQVDGNASDSHLLQLRFLALKNLANVFLQQGSAHYEGALCCYLQAVEIDSKDSVVWNQLGTLSCSMGLLSISRWAFEQGLLCSPNNWNCMEKLLEILIAIGDEVACLSVAELILRHWPTHSRALHVKNTIEESEAVPFAPRGIDKLEPKHVRLKFPDKRKAADANGNEGVATKKLCYEIELILAELSWSALIDALLDILLPLNGCGSEKGTQNMDRPGDVRLKVRLPSLHDIDLASGKKEVFCCDSLLGDYSIERPSDRKEREGNNYEEHPQERRSTRLESLRSRKPGKEEFDFAASKDLAKDVLQFVEHFILENLISKDPGCAVSCVVPCPEKVLSCDTEQNDVYSFISETSKNYGAYHVGHLLLEHAASSGSLLHQDGVVKFLQLERLTRQWEQDRTPECSLFLAELYYDLGSFPCNGSKLSEFMAEVSYHLCKIIESVALDYPLPMTQLSCKGGISPFKSFEDIGATVDEDSSFKDSSGNILFLNNKCTFWVRYIWLSGKMSIFEENKVKAHQEFCTCLLLLEKKDTLDNLPCSIHLPHLKINKELTISKILYEINMLKVDFLLEKTLGDLIKKEKYVECINLLVPLLFSMEDIQPNILVLPAAGKIGEVFSSVELSALDILIKACEKEKPTYAEVRLNCHRRKLQILMVLAGMDEYIYLHHGSGVKSFSASHVSGKEVQVKNLDDLVAEEVKAISQCVSEMKSLMDPSSQSTCITISTTTISKIQLLLSAIMCHVAINHFSKKSSASVTEGTDQTQRCSFVDTCITFCKLQHLVLSVPVQTQVELIVAMHNLLAEYGLCCAGGVEGDEGLFLKFAIKHLLALDMKLKSNLNSSTRDQENKQPLPSSQNRKCRDELKSDMLNVEMGGTETVQSIFNENSDVKQITSKEMSSHTGWERESIGVEDQKQYSEEGKNVGEQSTAQLIGQGDKLNEDEREELELLIDGAMDQCFFCLYGLNLRSDASYEDDLVMHKNTSRGDYQTKEQCADVFKYILPYAKASSRTGLIKLRRVLRAIRKHFPQPPDTVLAENAIDRFLDDPDLCEDKLSEDAGSQGFLESITNVIFSHGGVKEHRSLMIKSSEPYMEVYCSLYYFLALSEEMNATDKWTGFVLTMEGEEFVQQSANLFKYDLLYNPLRFESWQRLANIYDEEVDLLLNDGSKHINVARWRKNASLPQRVETSRRRSKRCLLMSLALAKTSAQQSEMHELLALVYYDSLQNVVPFYDQRSFVPQKDAAWTLCCENSLRHFKKAFSLKQDWSHAFYMGKLCEKLGYSYDTVLSYYDKAIALNPSAVDPVYRMHASRLKLLCTLGRRDLEALKVLSGYSYLQSVKDGVMEILGKISLDMPQYSEELISEVVENEVEEAWSMLYKDCLSALEICLEGDLKHFHKARYMLAQGLFKRGTSGDLEKAKEELSFCFKSARSSFTINMWEIDGLVRKGRRKAPGFIGSKKVLEVNLPESSRKFITCIRKYLLFYLKLLEETGDICTLDRAFVSLRADKRFCLCIEDLVPIALGWFIKALVSSLSKSETALSVSPESSKNPLEKLFLLFLEQGNLWTEVSSLPEIRGPEMSESSLYGCLHRYIASLETNGKLDTLEAINEKFRKRFKNPKLSNSNCAKVYRHASVAWCRHLIVNLALITPLQLGVPVITQTSHLSDSSLENGYFLCVDLQANEFWSLFFEGTTYLENLETKWNSLLAKMKRIIIRKASDENLETANSLLRSSYNFYRESSCATLPSGVTIYLVTSQIASETQIHPGLDGVEILDLSIPRKLLLWAYTLLHGCYANISTVVKHCEETVKSKMRRAGASSVPPNTSMPCAPTTHAGGSKEDANQCGVTAILVPFSVCQGENSECKNPSTQSFCEKQKSSVASPQQCHCDESMADRCSILHEDVDSKRI